MDRINLKYVVLELKNSNIDLRQLSEFLPSPPNKMIVTSAINYL